jgi:hypothetical protein
MGLSFTIAAGPHQSSHCRVRVSRDKWLCFTVSESIHPQPGGPGPRIYIPHEWGFPVTSPGVGFPLRRFLWLAGLRWGYSNPARKRLFAGETRCPQSCSLTAAVLLSAIYTAVTWQWTYMSQYVTKSASADGLCRYSKASIESVSHWILTTEKQNWSHGSPCVLWRCSRIILRFLPCPP